MNNHFDKFLRGEFLTMSVLGALGRSNTYSESASESDKENLRNSLRNKLDELAADYASVVTEKDHISNIKELADDLSSKFSSCLKNGRFRIGIAQKALNLYLKYLWCAKYIPLPPHCPFDANVIRNLPGCTNVKWTLIDTIDEYTKLVGDAKNIAESKSLSEWELEIWNDRAIVSKPRPRSKRSFIGSSIMTNAKAQSISDGTTSQVTTFWAEGKIQLNQNKVLWEIWIGKECNRKNIMANYVETKLRDGDDGKLIINGKPYDIALHIYCDIQHNYNSSYITKPKNEASDYMENILTNHNLVLGQKVDLLFDGYNITIQKRTSGQNIHPQ